MCAYGFSAAYDDNHKTGGNTAAASQKWYSAALNPKISTHEELLEQALKTGSQKTRQDFVNRFAEGQCSQDFQKNIKILF